VRPIGRDALPDPQLRLVGTGMPGLQAGTFTSSHDGISFLLVGRAERFLRIDADRGKVRCTVVQVRDPDLLVASLPGANRSANEFLKELYAAGEIDAGQFDTGVAAVLAARTEPELANVVRSLPAPVVFTSLERRLASALEIQGGIGRLRLAGRWQIARETHVSADLGSVRLDLTEAEFDGDVIDLHVYSGWGSITIIVPRGVAVQIIHHKGGVDSPAASGSTGPHATLAGLRREAVTGARAVRDTFQR